MKQKLQHLQAQLAHGFVGRDEIIKSALLSVVAGENLLLIGPPGTGKSMVARRVSQALKMEQTPPYFEYLLTKFSTPEEIFGTLSISELKQDRFKRNTQGYLPTVKIAFLDEIFKASSSILNALLTILNERKFHNGTITEDVPLQSLIGASNELPLGQTELSALYDRFLIRRFVDYIDESSLSALFDLPNVTTIQDKERLTAQELKEIQQNAKNVEFPNDVQSAILEIWKKLKEEFKENSDEQFSDRRFVKLIHLMRISAVTNGRNQVDFSDVLLLKDCIWNNPENIEQCLTIIKSVLAQYDQVVSLDKPIHISQAHTKITETKKPSQAVIKGYKGAGTKDDPILIENLNHLKGLERPEVGQQGYHFKQIADIDCSSIDNNSWFNINFKGYYDGNHKTIICNSNQALFKKVIDSELNNINLENLALAEQIENCTLLNCSTTATLLGYTSENDGLLNIKNSIIHYCSDDRLNSINSTIRYCHAGYYIACNIEQTTVEYCTSNSALIRYTASNHSKILNCAVYYINNNIYSAGIACNLNSSIVENCYVEGCNQKTLISSGIAYRMKNNSCIQQCAINHVIPKYSNTHRICDYYDRTSILKQNASIDTNNHKNGWRTITEPTANGRDGEDISSRRFKQHYFENTLGWDFEKIWQWNAQENRPELRPHTAPPQHNRIDLSQLNKTQSTLLAEQLKANMWL